MLEHVATESKPEKFTCNAVNTFPRRQFLAKQVKSAVFGVSAQNRHVVAMLQTFGYGSKTSLRQTDEFIVLPIRFDDRNKKHRISKMIQRAQKQLLRQLHVVNLSTVRDALGTVHQFSGVGASVHCARPGSMSLFSVNRFSEV